MSEHYEKYGKCMGVPGYVSPHIFYDGQAHHAMSHGLCPECRKLALRLWRIQLRGMETDNRTTATVSVTT